MVEISDAGGHKRPAGVGDFFWAVAHNVVDDAHVALFVIISIERIQTVDIITGVKEKSSLLVHARRVSMHSNLMENRSFSHGMFTDQQAAEEHLARKALTT